MVEKITLSEVCHTLKTTFRIRWFFCGGEKGIRTLDTFRYTRFPGARVRPDYATSPFGPFGRVKNFTINELDREGTESYSNRVRSLNLEPIKFQFFLLQYPFK